MTAPIQPVDVWDWPRAVVCEDAHDGDTFRADVDLGRGIIWRKASIRLNGINAPELRAVGGPEARDYLRGLIPLGTSIRLRSVGYDKFRDRVDAYVTRKWDGLDVNADMISSGHAVVYIIR